MIFQFPFRSQLRNGLSFLENAFFLFQTPEMPPAKLTTKSMGRSVVDLSTLSTSELMVVRDRMEQSNEICLTLVYTDWSTQIRETVEVQLPRIIAYHNRIICLNEYEAKNLFFYSL